MLSKRVKLEPELEEIAGLWPAAKRFEMARKLARWVRQLRTSARIMMLDSQGPRRRKSLPKLPRAKAILN
jgi:hypothetical protein